MGFTQFYLHFRLSAKITINDFFSSKSSNIWCYHISVYQLSRAAFLCRVLLCLVFTLHSFTHFLSLSQQLGKGNTPAGLLLKEVMTLYEEDLLKPSSYFPFLFMKTDDRFSLACPGQNRSLYITDVHLPFLSLVSLWIFITFNLGLGHS